MNFQIKHPENLGGMNERVRRLRQQNFDTPTTLSIERARIETAFYKKNYGTMPIAVLRARNFYEICQKKTIYIGPDELIVGERGPVPKAVPTFPELTCHSVEDLHTLMCRANGKMPIMPVSLQSSWSSELPDTLLWMVRCIMRDCSM